MEFPLLNQQGASVGTVELRDDVFGVLPHEAVVHQALVRQLSNARQGTHSTKTRGEVEGSTRKLFKQKGTGRARQGSIRAPHRRGGGIVFGPKPRSYRKAMPKKMRRLAIRSVLSAKAKDRELILLDALVFETPKTKDMVQTLARLGVEGRVLVVCDNPSRNLVLSGRNAPGVFTLPANQLNVGSMLSYRYLVMTLDAARRAEALWGQQQATAEEGQE
ncbi:MAG: 50S ribosomal protein L4 [Dehalococcoidia bacterium]|nr:50S ribosomal protein L4 [Dehalococcoidia bacterium]